MDHVVSPGPAEFSPGHVRSLRGALSRAAFARALGVTPQTIYRWELPDGAAEARRPRREQVLRLQRFAQTLASPQPRAAGASSQPTAALVSLQPTAAGAGSQPSAALVSLHPTAALLSLQPTAAEANGPRPPRQDDDLARVLPALERVFRGDMRHGYVELVKVVASAQGLSPSARAAACYGIGLCEVLDRSDPRAALLAISQVLGEAEAGRLSPQISAKLFAVAALVHACPDGLLYDLGRVHGYQARIEAVAGRTDQEASCIACLAALYGASQAGDLEQLERSFHRLEETRWQALPPLLELHVEEFRIMRAMFAGRSTLSKQTCEHSVSSAERHGYPLLLARSLGRLALCELDNLADPAVALAIARRARTLPRARTGLGVHQLLGLRAEVEALLRLGRIDEALEVSDEIDEWSAETGVPALNAISAQARLLYMSGRLDALEALATRLRGCEVPSLRETACAYASYIEACAMLASNADPLATVAAFEQAEREAQRWPFLLREVLLQRVYAHASAGQEGAARIALRRLQRCVDGMPTPWFTAHVRRMEGGLLAARGLWAEGRQLLESAEATFELAQDRADAALTRYLYCLIAQAFETLGPGVMDQARERLSALGLREPAGMQRGVALLREQLPARSEARPAAVRGSERLIVPFQRVAMRGAAPSLILNELVAVAAGLFPQHAVYLEELDSAGAARALAGRAPASGISLEWVEFSDGAGRLLRIGAEGALDPEARATLSLLAMTASLALEIAVLRSVGERALPSARDAIVPELPGFVAASSEMRRLRSELVRLSSSRSTVIITGESGVGKEIVARAIHDLSERAAQPHVAFNCATVPRELFEGQLFGYRRGAFTGASADHPGMIRAANRGTLFLDEIGELPLDIQPKLLRFLENAEVFPLGERAPVRVDVRVIAATHRDLAALVRAGRFREDLYYRLQVVPVFVPPLRERSADIPVLARYFLRDLTRRGEPPVLAPDALSALLGYGFPGNVRELKNIIERALAFYPDQPVLRVEHMRLPEGGSLTAAV